MDDLISRQAAIDSLHMHLMYRMGTDSNKKRLDDWINGVPSAQPEPCDDPRADIYYLAEKIGIHRLYALVVELRGEPEPCKDAVSRQAAIDEIDEWIKAFRENGHKESAADARLIKDGIIQLPSAQPEIIRCKECKKQDTNNVFRSMWCYEMQVFVKPNEFCSRADMREEDV